MLFVTVIISAMLTITEYSINFLRDPVIWNPALNGVFYVTPAWYATKETRERVPGFVQFDSIRIPEWPFVLLLCCLKRLATRDRWQEWGMEVVSTCVLCNFGR